MKSRSDFQRERETERARWLHRALSISLFTPIRCSFISNLTLSFSTVFSSTSRYQTCTCTGAGKSFKVLDQGMLQGRLSVQSRLDCSGLILLSARPADEFTLHGLFTEVLWRTKSIRTIYFYVGDATTPEVCFASERYSRSSVSPKVPAW